MTGCGRKEIGEQIGSWEWARGRIKMSRIFDALQRSGTEQSGIEYPDMVSVAEVFEAPQPRTVAEQPPTDHALSFQEPLIPSPPVESFQEPLTESAAAESLRQAVSQFPSLEVSVTAGS